MKSLPSDDVPDQHRCIAIMLKQEDTHYTCPDYLSSDWLAQQWSSSRSQEVKRVVDECASLVTDMTVKVESRESSPRIKKSPSSTAVATTFAGSRPVTPHLHWESNSHLGPWRNQMCTWAYSAVDTFGLDREIVAVTFHLLDRYLAKESLTFEMITREDFQLFTMTALYIAVKMLEPVRKLSTESLKDMSRGFYSEQDILETELDMLHSLEWHINPPTAIAFIREFLDFTSAIKETSNLFNRCRRASELAVQDCSLLSCRASSVAVAAIVLKAEDDPRFAHEDIDQFLTEMKEIGVDMEDVAVVYRRLEVVSC